MALSLQSEIYFAAYTVWSDPADDARCRGWLDDQMKRMKTFSDAPRPGRATSGGALSIAKRRTISIP
jgi:hypothetical protein